MRYLPATSDDIQKMMSDIGIQNLEELFKTIPAQYQYQGQFSFPAAMSEQELTQHLFDLSVSNLHALKSASFLGGGAYHHYVPALVDALISRGEFMTSYTPYQPEISQGTLQAIFEFQTYMCQITGMDIANASMYDGASAAAEAVLMAKRIHNDRKKVVISQALHPNYRKVIRTYTANLPIDLVEVPFDAQGRTDSRHLAGILDDSVICVVVQSPNYLGAIEDQDALFAAAKAAGATSISVVAEAMSLGILKPPAACGADIVVGESQSLGLPVGYGGPYAGFFAVRQPLMRQMPGRLVGMAKDHDGRRGFVLTLAAREQHIRREKATSNICTNQGLCALAVTVYLSFLGAEGFREIAIRNLQMADYAKGRLKSVAKIRFDSPNFNEFVIEFNRNAEEVVQALAEKKILAGIPLGRHYSELKNCLLVCCTETTTKEQVDRFGSELEALR